MKATELLLKQHRDIEGLFQRLQEAGQGDDRAIRQELAAILVAHTAIEKESFYPSLRDALPEEINEALEEHGLADVELARLLAAKPGDETSDAKLAVLSEIVRSHIRSEESEIFPAAERELTSDAINDLGDVMALRFRKILDSGYSKLLQRSLDVVVPRTPSRSIAKKAARRAPTPRKKPSRPAALAKRASSRAVPRRAPTKRAATQRRQGASKPKRTRASAGATRTRA